MAIDRNDIIGAAEAFASLADRYEGRDDAQLVSFTLIAAVRPDGEGGDYTESVVEVAVGDDQTAQGFVHLTLLDMLGQLPDGVEVS